MIRLSDAFIALPGGVGTLEELSEVVSLYRLGQTKKPCFLFNINGYYDALGAVFDTMVLHGFLPEEDRACIRMPRTIEEIQTALTRP